MIQILNFTKEQLERISCFNTMQQERLSLICSALAIDSLYIFNQSKQHPLGNYLCDIAEELRIKANISENEYCYLCGLMGAMELDKILDFVSK